MSKINIEFITTKEEFRLVCNCLSINIAYMTKIWLFTIFLFIYKSLVKYTRLTHQIFRSSDHNL